MAIGGRHELNRDAAGQPAARHAAAVAAAKRLNASALARMSDPDTTWLVADTHEGGELGAQRELRGDGVPAFVLLEPYWREDAPGRRQLSARPAVPGLLFVGVQRLGDAHALFRKRRVWSADDRPGKVLSVPADQLRAFVVRASVHAVADDAPAPAIGIGARVCVAAGPFAGLAGPVALVGRGRVGVVLDLFGARRVVQVPVDVVREAA